ncbi:nicotinate phosphoribosyltransferase isoform X1 [Microplitis mediator]|uniref:nicotinate phosphoribosyltransferase isoform X1 n=1 Tax=Microplitis mediator TaxID=375433 RepID=UPI0025572970|nr:nicotinate phosphoribosyltransferase isoform X1 [Microplitis mediator]XP_057331270.1 nicotinate phosphoribosyltransferase isoform X1 [Microplitis mediator]
MLHDSDCQGLSNGTQQNSVVQPLLTDLYQITMAYAYWKCGKMNDYTTFDLFFRKNPFRGEFAIFAGLGECLKFMKKFKYSESDIEYLKTTMSPSIEPEFFEYLKGLTPKDVTLYAIEEGSAVFPRVPLIRVEGPLIMVQLLETTLLTLVNYASLMATNAARYRMAAGNNVSLLEFGLRRAQGPDGGLSASKYSYIGGFDGTSNVLAGKLYDIPVRGTHAHAYINSFAGIDELKLRTLVHKETGEEVDLLKLSCKFRQQIASDLGALVMEASDSELAALVGFAIAFPDGFMALVDTYDVKSIKSSFERQSRINNQNNKYKDDDNNINDRNDSTINNELHKNGYSTPPHNQQETSHCLNKTPTYSIDLFKPGELGELCVRSGLLNFCAVALALSELGYRAVGIRIDSGDLAYLSQAARDTFVKLSERFKLPWFAKMTIVASNDINEETIMSLNEQNHQIDCFGVGTHLVTCQRQPALGCVYKMVEINNHPRIKLSQEVDKITIPGRKNAYRLYGADSHALIDLLQRCDEPPPQVGTRVLCRHPFQESKRAYVIPTRVETLHKVYWKDGKIVNPLPSLQDIRNRVSESLKTLRTDHKRSLNPTPYKVAVSDDLYTFIHDLWVQNAPIGELS